jgi:probable phosphoglycerate mutase
VIAVSAHELWLVRHGETEWSAAGKHTGRTDLPLTVRGRSAAIALGQTIRSHTFDRVLTSPLRRARDTCELAGLGDRMKVVEDLREWDYGDYEGVTTAEIRATRPDWSVWVDGCPGGETADDVGARADRVIAAVRSAVDGPSHGDCIAFAHGHLLRVLAARWVALPASDGALLSLDTASVSVLGWEREQPVVRRWNVTST